MEARDQLCYRVTFSDGGTSVLNRDEQLEVGDEIVDFGDHYVITEVDQPISGHVPGNAWALFQTGAAARR